eukprot:8702307-Alexandrium_andersonii.AAC.1
MGRLKKGQASGPGGIPPELYTWMGEGALQRLVDKFNEYTAAKEFPTSWKEADAVAIFKKGSAPAPE